MRKKIIALFLICISVLNAANVYAAGEININKDKKTFEKVIVVKDGHLYIPLRLAFTNHDLPGGDIVKVRFDKENKIISIITGPTDVSEEVKAAKTNKAGVPIKREYQREAVILWGDYPAIMMYKYDVYEDNSVELIEDYYSKDFEEKSEDANGVTHLEVQWNLGAPILLDTVDEEGGQRVLLSVEDIRTISNFLFGWNEYDVTVGGIQ